MDNKANGVESELIASCGTRFLYARGTETATSRNSRTKDAAGRLDRSLSPTPALSRKDSRRRNVNNVRFKQSVQISMIDTSGRTSPSESAAARGGTGKASRLAGSTTENFPEQRRGLDAENDDGAAVDGAGGETFSGGTGHTVDGEDYDDVINISMHKVLEQLEEERNRLKSIDRGMSTLVDSVLTVKTRTAHEIIGRTLRHRSPSLLLTRAPLDENLMQCKAMAPRYDILMGRETPPLAQDEEEEDDGDLVQEGSKQILLDFYAKHSDLYKWVHSPPPMPEETKPAPPATKLHTKRKEALAFGSGRGRVVDFGVGASDDSDDGGLVRSRSPTLVGPPLTSPLHGASKCAPRLGERPASSGHEAKPGRSSAVAARRQDGTEPSGGATAAVGAFTAAAATTVTVFAAGGIRQHDPPSDPQALVLNLSLKRSLSEKLSSDFRGVSGEKDCSGYGSGGDQSSLIPSNPDEVLKSIQSMLTDIQTSNPRLSPYLPSFVADSLTRARASKTGPQPLAAALSTITTAFRPSSHVRPGSTCTTTAPTAAGAVGVAALAAQASGAWTANAAEDKVANDPGGSDAGGDRGEADGCPAAGDVMPAHRCPSSLVHLARELQPLHKHVMRTRRRRGSASGLQASSTATDNKPKNNHGNRGRAVAIVRFESGRGRLDLVSPSPTAGGGDGGGTDSTANDGDDEHDDKDLISPEASGRCTSNASSRGGGHDGGGSGRGGGISGRAADAQRRALPPEQIQGPQFCMDSDMEPEVPLWTKPPAPDPMARAAPYSAWNSNGVIMRHGSALLRAGLARRRRRRGTEVMGVAARWRTGEEKGAPAYGIRVLGDHT
ncbi:hypothetical protein VOLCADRAFT_91792 [Volvox carteri f. nagariensis]|uniref:Uncharacterized protein n=1 Tax=Volvox carteri f. nagariensis TaxID=3068 RepID=D8TXZ0_VOLCA|nr:uncharacterized protein VOLCADRAFT_91792 [Volvox carteri f. nagariensis]EFJ47807.1 hypothetical protein VOLCADRAFT_91792 [Volvox carteri f. nagariensis]|eukprot:XP_002951278.1 hypothetical protein VOLCADRAFT_91792 [Volvox carteri f. nagariensis]